MTRAIITLVSLSAATLFAADPDPAKLDPTADQIAHASKLVAKLGDPNFRVREGATVELRKLGRTAKSVVAVTVKSTEDPEVRSRCENLLSQLEKDDLKVRLAAFLADTENRYTHELPAWDRLAKITGTTKHAKQLYANLCETPQNFAMLKAVIAPQEQLNNIVIQRRTQLYAAALRANRSYEYASFNSTDVAGLLLCEIQLGTTISARTTSYTMNTMLLRIREELHSESGEPLRKLSVHWMDTRTDPTDVVVAMRIAGSLGLKDAPVARYAEKLLKSDVPIHQRMTALTSCAQFSGKESLTTLTKYLADDTKHTVAKLVEQNKEIQRGNEVVIAKVFVPENVELQMRDVALAMCLVVNDLNPLDFGFELRFPRTTSTNLPESLKYSFGQYLFSTDTQRKAAFAKWNEFAQKAKK